MSEVVHNVSDRRHDWIGPWEVEPLDFAKLSEADVGRTIIYRDHISAEAGTLKSWGWSGTEPVVWGVFHRGDTAAACSPEDLCWGVRSVPAEEVLQLIRGEANDSQT